MSKIKYIDLFAGAGGLSEGFVRNGFQPLAHVEADPAAVFTLKTRVAFHYLARENNLKLYHDYLKGTISRKQLYNAIPADELDTVIAARIGEKNTKIFEKLDELVGEDSVDLIIGGPPCQAYSVVGRAPLKHKTNDERTKLYVHYGRFLNRYRPKAFVFENVPGLLSSAGGQYYRNLKKYYKRLGYEVQERLLNARDFNVVQHRERVIIIGWRKELNWSYPEFLRQEKLHFRDDIFGDLPAIGTGETNRIQYYSREPGEYVSNTNMRNCVEFVSQHITRPHNERDLAIYKLAITRLEEGIRLKNDKIPEELRTQKNVESFLDRFKVVGETPHTVIAHIAKDGHHFIHPDPQQLRSISVREAARIQSFPDDYYFEGSTEYGFRTPAFRQIGNAVPPLMACAIAEKIKEMMSNG
ncbi:MULTISPECIES: DNA cytosine methyltransferase [Kordiimonas]|jgi:DNA (cytosine-5)-methyltransferase 1|uniref:DNA cytosine methyltransferase n=1 Tax=Kordiimonas TaxID=288021 RepID=UPI00257E85D7|nr:DNA cytosine methyltransferase [Kordiimonas sp. UBA4487]